MVLITTASAGLANAPSGAPAGGLNTGEVMSSVGAATDGPNRLQVGSLERSG